MKKISRIKMIRRDDWLVEACRGKRVLHIGCTDSPITTDKISNRELLHFKLAAVAKQIIGLDEVALEVELADENSLNQSSVETAVPANII